MRSAVGGRVVGQAPRELDAGRVAQGHHVPLAEAPDHLHDADGQQAAALLCDGPPRPGVHHAAGRAAGRCSPASASRPARSLPCGRNSVPTGSAAKMASRTPGRAAVGHDDRLARRRRQPGGAELAAHPARAQGALAAAGPVQHRASMTGTVGTSLGVGVGVRVAGVEPIHDAEQDRAAAPAAGS